MDVHRQENHYLEFKHNIEGKEYLIFAIYDMKGFIVAFPVSEIGPTALAELKQRLKVNKETIPMYKYGSFYKKNDYIAYGMLDIEKDKVVAYNDVYCGTEGIYFGVDGFWDFVEKWLYNYRGVPKQYFHKYLKEMEFRFNSRNKDMFFELSKLLVEPLPSL